MNKLKVIFMGTPSFASHILEALIEKTDVIMVVCQPDRQKDRKGNLLFPEVKKLALENNIEVFQPDKIKENYEYILQKNPDIIITCAYGQIIPSQILDYPKYGCINVHGSLLPELRGGAPIHHAIIRGYDKTGITIMYMDKKMDSGDIITSREIPILKTDTLDTLYDKLSYVGRDLLLETLPSIINKTNKRIKQDESKVTYAYNITKEEEIIDFNDTALNIFNKVRGLCSIPGASTYLEDKRVKVYEVEVTDNTSIGEYGEIIKIDKNSIVVNAKDFQIKIKDIKFEGKKRCKVSEYLNGIKNKDELIGKVFSNERKNF